MADQEKTAVPDRDPALLPENQHTHPHVLHSPSAEADEIVYSTGTSVDPPHVPKQHHLPTHHHAHGAHSHENSDDVQNRTLLARNLS